MKLQTSFFLMLLLLIAGTVTAAENYTTEQQTRVDGFLNKELYIYETKLVGSREAFKEHLSAHLDYQVKLENEGIMFGAGPLFTEGNPKPGSGMIIVRADSFEEAKAIADADPFHAAGVRTYTLRKWVLNEGGLKLSIKMSDQSVEIQ